MATPARPPPPRFCWDQLCSISYTNVLLLLQVLPVVLRPTDPTTYLFAREAILQDEGELGGAVGDVGRVGVQGPDALLEGQEGLVDLGAFEAPLAVVRLGVGAALRAYGGRKGEMYMGVGVSPSMRRQVAGPNQIRFQIKSPSHTPSSRAEPNRSPPPPTHTHTRPHRGRAQGQGTGAGRHAPARSTRESLPYIRPDSLARRTIWQMAWERELTSFTSVALVVRLRLPWYGGCCGVV